MWDVKPFNLNGRLKQVFAGCPHGHEHNLLKTCWSPCGDFVATGSADHTVMVYHINGDLRYKLPGHKGCVNEVSWGSNLLASCSNDKTIYVGEINLDEVR